LENTFQKEREILSETIRKEKSSDPQTGRGTPATPAAAAAAAARSW
jgi:hypothetical protein